MIESIFLLPNMCTIVKKIENDELGMLLIKHIAVVSGSVSVSWS